MSTTIKFEHEAQQNEETYKIGSWFVADNEIYQLVQVGENEVNLMCIKTGNRVDKQIKVADNCHVPASVITKLTEPSKWQRVSVEITTKPYRP